MASSTGRTAPFDPTSWALSMAIALSGMIARSMNDKAERNCLSPYRGIKSVHLYVVVWERGAAAVDLGDDGAGIEIVELGQTPHRPVVVARRGRVSELDGHRPT